MGKKTYRNSVTQRLLESDDFKSSKDFGMHRYIIEQRRNLRPNRNSVSLAECVRESRITAMPTRFRQAYTKAKNTDSYIFGLPKSALSTSHLEDTKAAFKKYIERVEGKQVDILYNTLAPKNPYHYAWKKLYEDYLYSGKTNEIKRLSIQTGQTCYLVSSQMTLTQKSIDEGVQDGTLYQYGLAMSYGKTPNREADSSREQPEILIGDEDKLVFTYTYKQGDSLVEGTETISLSDVFPVVTEDTVKAPKEVEYMQSMYQVDGVYKLFTYEYMSGGITEIDKAESYQEPIGNYYPRLYTRIDSKDLIDRNSDDIGRKHTASMMKSLGLDLESLTKNINEGIDDLDDSFKFIFIHLSIAVNKDMDDLVTGEYLFNYFNTLYERSDAVPVADRQTPALPNEKSGINQFISDKVYSQEVAYWKSGKSIRTGVATNNKKEPLKKGEHTVKYQVKTFSSSRFANKVNVHTFIYQNGDNQYTELNIYNLKITQHFQGHTVTAGGDDDNLTIPLDIDVVSRSDINERELLMNRALQITVSAVKVVKKKWYERGFFKFVLAAISVAINLIVPGAGFTVAALIEAVLVTVLVSIAVKILIDIAIKIAISLGLSPEVTALLTVVLVAAGAFSGKIDFSKMLNAKNLMEASNYALDMYGRMQAERINAVFKKMDEFQEYAKSEWERLKAAQAMLDTGVIPMSLEQLTAPINGVNIYLGEEAKDFYTRSQFVDVFDITYNSVDYFLQAAMEVPKQFNKLNQVTEDPFEVLLIK